MGMLAAKSLKKKQMKERNRVATSLAVKSEMYGDASSRALKLDSDRVASSMKWEC